MSEGKADNHRIVVPIKDMAQYGVRWTIRACVAHKSSIHCHEGVEMFSVDLQDESGEIHAAVKRDQVLPRWKHFCEMFEPNKVYYVTVGWLKPADRTYISLDNDNVLILTEWTTVEICNEATPQIPTIARFNFTPIRDRPQVKKSLAIDIIGIGEPAEESSGFSDHSEMQSLPRRKIRVTDRTGSVELTLFGDQIEKFDGIDYAVVAVRGATVGHTDRRSLFMGRWGYILVNPDLPVAHSLRDWWRKRKGPMDSFFSSVLTSTPPGIQSTSLPN